MNDLQGLIKCVQSRGDTKLVMLTLTFKHLSSLWIMFLKYGKGIVVAWGSLVDKTNPDNNFKSKKHKK